MQHEFDRLRPLWASAMTTMPARCSASLSIRLANGSSSAMIARTAASGGES